MSELYVELVPNAQPGQDDSWAALNQPDADIITRVFGHDAPVVYREWAFLKLARKLGYRVLFRTDLPPRLPPQM